MVSIAAKAARRLVANAGPILAAWVALSAFDGWAREVAAVSGANPGHSLDLLPTKSHAAVTLMVLLLLFALSYSLYAHRRIKRQTARLTEADSLAEHESQERAIAIAESTRLGRILEDSWNEIYIFDMETFRFNYGNKGALKNIGYSLEEMRERTAYDIKPDFTRDTFIATVQPLIDGTQDYLVFETTHQRNDGSTYPVEVRLQLLAHEDPPVFFAVINDISLRKIAEQKLRDLNATLEKHVEARTQALSEEVAERKATEEKLRASEAHTQLIVNSAIDAIITIDGKGTVQSFNHAAEKIFGFSVVDVVGKNISMLMPPEIAKKHDEYLAPYRDGGAAKLIGQSREVVGRRKDGEIIVMELSVSEFSHNGVVHYVGIARDISERKEAQAKLHATLEELRTTQSELVQADKLASLGGLVAGVAHEVNTPVGIGVTATSYLKERTETLRDLFLTGKMKKSDLESFLDIALQSADILSTNLFRASDLIRSFKQVAIDQSSEEVRQFSVGNYLNEVVISLQPNLKRTKHEIIIDGDPAIKLTTFPGSLSQIATNLVMNSLIHGYDEGEAGTIKFTFKETPQGVEFIYTDDGKGVAPEHLDKIFDPFFTTKRGAGGSGLGMHILFNLVTQKLGGTVRCQSKLGNGIKVTIVIPDRTEKGEAA